MVALLTLAVVAALNHQGVLRRRVTGWLLAGLCTFGVWQYPFFGALHAGRNIHPNEFTHYYFGGKYFDEIGYQKFYIAIAIGLEEATGSPVDRVRDLENKGGYISRAEFIAKAPAIKSRFTPARWRAFVSDLRELAQKIPGFTYQTTLLDAGFNGSPTWVLFSRLITWIPPAHAYFVTSVDVLLTAGAVCLLGIAFGWPEALMGLALFLYFPSGAFSTFDWTGGSVLRLLWVFWLTLGLFFYRRNQPLWAGVAFALATLDRLFPGAFAAAAVIVPAVEAWRTSRSFRIFKPGPWRFVVLLAAGGVLAAAVSGSIPELLWPGAWRGFAANISEHTHYLFSNHFGWSKVAAFYPEQGDVVFSNLTPRIFADWSAAMLLRTHWPFFVVSGFVVWALIWIFSPLRLPAEAAICLMGLSFIFFNALPAHYYLTMLLPIGAVFASKKLPLPVVCAFWLLWTSCSVVTILPENVGWAFASVLMMAMFTFSAVFLAVSATRSPQFRGRVGAAAAVGLLAVHAGIVWPADGARPPTSYPEATAVPLSYHAIVPLITRTFPDAFARIITDTGGVIASGGYAQFESPIPPMTGSCRVILRTDRFFTGTLELSSDQQTLQRWPIEGRGWLFDYVSAVVPCLPTYRFRWVGPDNIALFQTWIESAR